MRISLTLLCLLAGIGSANSQVFGGHPGSQKWKQLNTDTARIIFAPGLDSQANRVASIVHYLAKEKPYSLGDQLKKINIVLQHQTVIPNAYVGLGPWRSEFFMNPDPDNFSNGSIAWADQLALHEYRHVQQFNNFNNGISKLMKVISGEDGYNVAVNAAIPDWFFEGDAVFNETVLSNQGRGRMASFLNAYPALWQSGKKYSWAKLRNGSLKDYVPNHYYLGYLLVNYGRMKYGADFWTKVTRDASAYKGLLYPFQAAIKRHAGVDYKTFREAAFTFYREKIARVAVKRDTYLAPVNKEFVTNYSFPYQVSPDSLLYLKTSYRHRPAFYIRTGNKERRLRVRDISVDQQFSYRNGKIVYAAYETDARWHWKDYSVLKVLDVQSGRQATITSKSKYFTPDISADGTLVAAVQVAPGGASELHILDAANGAVKTRIHSADIALFTDPKFADEHTVITAVRLKDGRMALAAADITTGNTVRITPPSYNVVGYPSISNGVVYFTANYGGNDDVYALRMQEQKIYKLSNGPLGNYFVNAANGKLTWSAFTAEGYQLQQVNEKDLTWTEAGAAATSSLNGRYEVATAGGTGDVLADKIPDRRFTASNYRNGKNLLNIHSWRPYYEDPVFTYSLYGENVLNTLQTEIYYSYNQNEKNSSVGFNAVYGRWFPYLNLGSVYTFDRQLVTGNKLRHFDQLDNLIGLSVPLSMVKGRTFRNFNINTFYVLRNEFNKGFFKDSIGNTLTSYLQHGISWNQTVQRAVQDFYPRLGYAVSVNNRHAISRYKAWQWLANGTIYLPGAMHSHNIVLTGSFQEIDTLRQLTFSDRFPYSRGFTGRYFSRMWRVSANYHLPLLYPDWGFGNILYLQRVRANLFYDFTRVYSRDKSDFRNQRSYGGEIFVDTRWWNQYPLTFGFRVSRMLDIDQYDGFQGTVFELVLPVSIIPR